MLFKRSRKRVIWWERDVAASGAAESRARGHVDGHQAERMVTTPYYGPVGLAAASDVADVGPAELAFS